MNLSEFRLHSNISWNKSGTIKQLPASFKFASIQDVKLCAAISCGITLAEFDSKTRKREVVTSRMLAINYVLKFHRLSLQKVGDIMGGKDHATILHAKRNFFMLVDFGDDIIRESVRRFNEELLKIDSNFKTL